MFNPLTGYSKSEIHLDQITCPCHIDVFDEEGFGRFATVGLTLTSENPSEGWTKLKDVNLTQADLNALRAIARTKVFEYRNDKSATSLLVSQLLLEKLEKLGMKKTAGNL